MRRRVWPAKRICRSGVVDAVDHDEQRTFAGAVGADQRADFAGLAVADGGDGLDALERQGDVIEPQ
jgi:hypothetical protein